MKSLVEYITEKANITKYTDTLSESNVNEGIKMEDLKNQEPSKIRTEVVKFLKDFMERSGLSKTYKAMYEDINVWNVTSYPKNILKTVLKNDKRATTLMLPIIDAVKNLKDYVTDKTKQDNILFKKVNSEDRTAFLDGLYSEELKQWLSINELSVEGSATIMFMIIDENQINEIGYKGSKDDLKKELSKLSKLYNDFEIGEIHGGFTIEGRSKNHTKKQKDLDKKYTKMVLSKNI